jgi:hypothetical protein
VTTRATSTKRKAEANDGTVETLNQGGAKVDDDKTTKGHSRTKGNKSQKPIPNTLNQQATMTSTATTPKRHPLLTTKPKRHTKPKRYTLLAKTMMGNNSPTMAKEKMTLNRHRKVTRAALWNHLRIVIIQARKV